MGSKASIVAASIFAIGVSVAPAQPSSADDMTSTTLSTPDTSDPAASTITYEGNVTKIMPNGFFVATRYTSRSIMIVTSPGTTYRRTSHLRPKDLPVGTVIDVNGDADATVKSLFIQLGYVENPNPAAANIAPPINKKTFPLTATVTALTPDVQVSTPDNSVYTLRLRNQATIIQYDPGSIDDIEIGREVRVTGSTTGSLDNETVSANHVELIAEEGQSFKKKASATPSSSATPMMAPAK